MHDKICAVYSDGVVVVSPSFLMDLPFLVILGLAEKRSAFAAGSKLHVGGLDRAFFAVFESSPFSSGRLSLRGSPGSPDLAAVSELVAEKGDFGTGLV